MFACSECVGANQTGPVTTNSVPPQKVPPGTFFLINMDPLELFLVKNLFPPEKCVPTQEIFIVLIKNHSGPPGTFLGEKFVPP